jgi:hypothetical protein
VAPRSFAMVCSRIGGNGLDCLPIRWPQVRLPAAPICEVYVDYSRTALVRPHQTKCRHNGCIRQWSQGLCQWVRSFREERFGNVDISYAESYDRACAIGAKMRSQLRVTVA